MHVCKSVPINTRRLLQPDCDTSIDRDKQINYNYPAKQKRTKVIIAHGGKG